MEPIQTLVKRWLDLDRDAITRSEVEQLLEGNDEAELERRLRNRIEFGTAGLRSSMKAGFAHMNSVTCIQASQGLAQYVLDSHMTVNAKHKQLAVVIGHDARYNSERFARLSAAAFLEKGLCVLWFDQLVHTPMVPFAVKYYGAAAGVMITASHNPKNDNGYKVYWSNGCQIIPPLDAGIAAAIEAESRRPILSWDTTQVDPGQNQLVRNIFSDVKEAYLDSISSLVSGFPDYSTGLKFMYTPMHGVGLPFMQGVAIMLELDSTSMYTVLAQADPNPEFPTVPFPNPEEKGALDLAKQEADATECSLILANDPDADRFAVAERLKSGEWHQFTGNQMGVLLASYILETCNGNNGKLTMLASTVSSRMLASVAKKEGFYFKETLTGFKWLGNVAQDLRRSGYVPLFAYEEAIGYMFPGVVWDKDGIAAAAVFLTACRTWKDKGLTPWTKLQELYVRYGYFEDANTYLITPSPAVTNAVFSDIRKSNNGFRPSSLGHRKILRWRDLTLGIDSGTTDNKPELPVDENAQMITCELDGAVFTARGSGTEPKIKLYIEATAESSVVAKEKANEILNDLLQEWFKAKYGLKLAGT